MFPATYVFQYLHFKMPQYLLPSITTTLVYWHLCFPILTVCFQVLYVPQYLCFPVLMITFSYVSLYIQYISLYLHFQVPYLLWYLHFSVTCFLLLRSRYLCFPVHMFPVSKFPDTSVVSGTEKQVLRYSCLPPHQILAKYLKN